MKTRATIPIAIILGGLIVAGAVYVSTPKNPSANKEDGNPALVRPVDSQDHILGNPSARAVIVEYSDFDCEYCKQFHDTLHQIIATEGVQGDVAWVYRQFPLTEIHPNALRHAEAAECAAQVGGTTAFWAFADLLFTNQPVDPSQYGTFAQKIGIPGNAFATCYAGASTAVDARIMADRKNALDMQAQGTPFSLILVTGKPPIVMKGGYPYDAVKALIKQALQ